MKRLLLFLIPLLGFRLGSIGVAAAAHWQVTPDNFEVMLAVATSASMRDAMPQAKQAAVEFLGQMPPDVRIGLESFGRTVTVHSLPTTDRGLLTGQINGLVADGDTPL